MHVEREINIVFRILLYATTVVITASAKRKFSVTPELFDAKVLLAHVKKLQVHNLVWFSLPEGDYFDDLETVQFFDVTPIGGFGACPQLEYLHIYIGDLSMTSSDWLSNCTNLRSLRIKGVNMKQIQLMLRSAVYAEELFIVDLQNIEEWAYSVENPIFLNRSSITKILLESTDNLENKNTRWADVSAGILKQFSLFPWLLDLLINIDGFDMCAGDFPPGVSRMKSQRSKDGLAPAIICDPSTRTELPLSPLLRNKVTLRSLRSLEIYNDDTTSVCFRLYRLFPQLKRLTFGCLPWHKHKCGSINIMFNVVDIFSSWGHNLNVSVSKRNIILQLSRADYLMLSSEHKKKVVNFDVSPSLGLTVDCNCTDMLWLARAVKMGYVTASVLRCRNGMLFAEFSCDRMECESMSCNSKCLCCRIGAHGEFILDCRGLQLTQLPIDLLGLPNLTEVYAPKNSISSLPRTLPESLHVVDVSGNQIRNINGVLLADKSRRWRLAGNPLTCACDNKLLLDMLQYRKEQIEDLEIAKCLNETLEISLQSLPDVCKSLELNITLSKEKESKNLEAKLAKDREETLVILVAVATVVAVVTLIIGLAYYYRRPIQILMFARGWCLCWLKDEDLDEDRRYDVFLSFCHEDAELVLGLLLPTLDQEFSVCVHLRDWMPGEMIPTQIRKSVENSRRTLIFLTKNFAESLWGLLEFQTAYARGLEERKIRVVMVVVDDVLESPNLNKDLREYVRFNTYVRWDDPWFWNKLRYALPHKVQSPQPHSSQHIVPALAEALQVLSIEESPRIPLPETLDELGNFSV